MGTARGSPEDEISDTTQPAPLIIQPGAPGEPYAVLSPEYVARQELPRHTEADVQFMEMMIVHHEQALEMTAMVADRTRSEDIPLLSLRMGLSQVDEIQLMQGWLDARKDIEPEELPICTTRTTATT